MQHGYIDVPLQSYNVNAMFILSIGQIKHEKVSEFLIDGFNKWVDLGRGIVTFKN